MAFKKGRGRERGREKGRKKKKETERGRKREGGREKRREVKEEKEERREAGKEGRGILMSGWKALVHGYLYILKPDELSTTAAIIGKK